jgi:PTS system nitrogen regulatory IIA component
MPAKAASTSFIGVMMGILAGLIQAAIFRRPVSNYCRVLQARQKSNSEVEISFMDLSDLINPESIFTSLKAKNKKHALQELSTSASLLTDLPERDIFDTLLQRERLGSTGVGQGIAIPHGTIAGLNKIIGLFARLEQPIEFEAVDAQPVDLVFLLLAPESAGADHLKALARISRFLRSPAAIESLRTAGSSDAVYDLLTEAEKEHAA